MVGTGHHVAAREIRRADHVDGPGAARLADPACGRTVEADCVGHFNANGRTRLRGPRVQEGEAHAGQIKHGFVVSGSVREAVIAAIGTTVGRECAVCNENLPCGAQV